MLQNNLYIQKIRFDLDDKNKLYVIGWFPNDGLVDEALHVYLDAKEMPFHIQREHSIEVRQKYIVTGANVTEEIRVCVELAEGWEKTKRFRMTYYDKGTWHDTLKQSTRKLLRMQRGIDFRIENGKLEDKNCVISGWAVSNGEIEIRVYDISGQEIEAKIEKNYRKDINQVYPEKTQAYLAGFTIRFPMEKTGGIKLELTDGTKTTVKKISSTQLRMGKVVNDRFSENQIVKGIRYWKDHGFQATVRKVYVRLAKKTGQEYREWVKQHNITERELKQQRDTEFAYNPVFSIVIPLYKTKPKFLRELVKSIQEQTYTNWELCLADGSKDSTDDVSPMRKLLDEIQKSDARIRCVELDENAGISGNTNAAIEMAKGDYIVFADHDDLLAANALFECVRALNEDPSIDVIYTDEDKIDMAGKKRFDPNFKPDFNQDMLRSVNYICHLYVVKKEIIDQVGMLRSEFDGAQDYDFIFRSTEVANKIHHIPKILYHWRCHMESTSSNPESKLYAFEAGRKAIEEHYHRMGIPAKAEHSSFYGMYRTRYQWEEEPLVSVIIPNKDHVDDLSKCIESVLEKSKYKNLEVIIVENNSEEDQTFSYYKKIEEKDSRVKVVYYEGDFNFSKINNYGAEFATGEYYLLLNNDTEMIDEYVIEEMLGFCMREDVGIVGARLYYEDDTIQHAGVVVGFGGIAGHTFIGASRYDSGYMNRIIVAQDYSAVTAACMMTKRSVFEEVGGLTEELKIAFNDIDYCMKVRERNYLVVYNPYAQLYHYESKSRGLEDTSEKVERFNNEIGIFAERWPEILKNGDPYYNPNLTLDKSDFSLR